MSNKDLLEGGLFGIKVGLDINDAENRIRSLRETDLVANSYKYVSSETLANGFKTIASGISDVVSQIGGSVPSQVEYSLGVVQLDKSAYRTGLVKTVGESDQTALTTITGEAALSSNGFLDVNISAPFPEAIAEVMQTTTTLSSSGIKDVVNNNINTELFTDGTVDTVLGGVIKSSNSLSNLLNDTVGSITSKTNIVLNSNSFGFNSFLENLIENTFKSANNTLAEVTKKGDVVYNISAQDLKKILNAKSQNDIEAAVDILEKYSDSPRAVLKETILKIDNRAAKVLEPVALNIDIPTKRTDNYVNLWREEFTSINSKVFDPIIRAIEIETEVANLRREVTEVIIFALGASRGNSVSVQEWHNQYVTKYEKGFNPHFYINKNGNVFRGRPLEVKSNNLSFGGYPDHSERSITILLEGNKAPLSDYTMMELKKILSHIYRVKPGIQVFGLNDIVPSEETPFVNIPRYVQNVFGKSNVSEYSPRVQAPLTQKQLIEYRG